MVVGFLVGKLVGFKVVCILVGLEGLLVGILLGLKVGARVVGTLVGLTVTTCTTTLLESIGGKLNDDFVTASPQVQPSQEQSSLAASFKIVVKFPSASRVWTFAFTFST